MNITEQEEVELLRILKSVAVAGTVSADSMREFTEDTELHRSFTVSEAFQEITGKTVPSNLTILETPKADFYHFKP